MSNKTQRGRSTKTHHQNGTKCAHVRGSRSVAEVDQEINSLIQIKVEMTPGLETSALLYSQAIASRDCDLGINFNSLSARRGKEKAQAPIAVYLLSSYRPEWPCSSAQSQCSTHIIISNFSFRPSSGRRAGPSAHQSANPHPETRSRPSKQGARPSPAAHTLSTCQPN